VGSLQLFEAFVLAATAALAADWWVERGRVRSFVRSLRNLPHGQRETAIEVGGRIFQRPRQPSDPAYLGLTALSPLGSSFTPLYTRGGCCSGTSRLYIQCLDALGLKAAQITLYHRAGNAQHCLVEVALDDGAIAVDPTYGLYYVDQGGRPLGLEGLRAGTVPLFRPLPNSQSVGYPAEGYFDFCFSLSKTANWTSSQLRRLVYRLARGIRQSRIDTMRLPAVLEWPQTLLAIGLLGLGLTAEIASWFA